MKILNGLLFIGLSMMVLISCTTTDDMDEKETMTYHGYLIDVACGESGQGMDGSDVVYSPQDHTTVCLIACKDSGFGISVMDGDMYTFIPFADDESNEKALEIAMNTTKEDSIKVVVEGYMIDGKLCVVSIMEED